MSSIFNYDKTTKSKFLFLRHAETPFNADPCIPTRVINPIYLDCELSETGIKQAKSMQEIVNKLKIEKIYVSPFYRTLQTVKFVFENHPNIKNIIVTVHPLLVEGNYCINDCIGDIKKSKNDFNMNSKIKIDWSLFDEYIKLNPKYDENFFYLENLNGLDENLKLEMYKNLKELYDKGEYKKFGELMSKYIKDRIDNIKKRPETLKHIYERFEKFAEFLKKAHANTANDIDNKVISVAHSVLLKIITTRTVYENDDIQDYHPDTQRINNCDILSVYI